MAHSPDPVTTSRLPDTASQPPKIGSAGKVSDLATPTFRGGLLLLLVLLGVLLSAKPGLAAAAGIMLPVVAYVCWSAWATHRFQLGVQEQIVQLDEARRCADAAALSKAQFLANMSHEIRTPMNGILGMAELMLRAPIEDEQKMMAETIQNSADALLTVLNDILDLSKIEAGKIELEQVRFDLARTLHECAGLLHGNADQKGIQLMTFIDPRIVAAHVGDAVRIRQVLLNLIGNAIKFTLHGEIVVGVDLLAEDDGAQVVSVSVRDTGIGISEEVLAKLFKPFAQADASTTRRFGGTGLGLAICARLVELMGGRLEVSSSVGHGSTFSFELLLPKVKHTEAAVESTPDLRQHAVLILDQNETNLNLLVMQLMPTNIGIDRAESAEGAIATLRAAATSGHPFTMALLDAESVAGNLLPFLEQIKRDPKIPHMAIAVVGDLDNRQALPATAKSSVLRWLSRPISNSALIEAVVAMATTTRTIRPDALSPHRDPQEELESAALAKLRVLVAEDHEVNRTVMQGMLKRLGCEAVFAVDGREALQFVQREDIGLVLMDCQMPDMDGFAATRAIRSLGGKYTKLPIVALTANVLPTDRQACLTAGMNDFLAKPVRLNVLRSSILAWGLPRHRPAGPIEAAHGMALQPATDNNFLKYEQ